ncbi:hypothetical protein NL676_000974 [Syzygium grande]|nr:hypothetical protein NL676_000974 [Syzygium grande]
MHARGVALVVDNCSTSTGSTRVEEVGPTPPPVRLHPDSTGSGCRGQRRSDRSTATSSATSGRIRRTGAVEACARFRPTVDISGRASGDAGFAWPHLRLPAKRKR